MAKESFAFEHLYSKWFLSKKQMLISAVKIQGKEQEDGKKTILLGSTVIPHLQNQFG